MDLRMVETEARHYATRIAQMIAAEANSKGLEEAPAFAGTAAAIAFQNIVTTLLLQVFPPGSPEGEAKIREVYESAIKDAVARWHKNDLKERGLGPRQQG